MGNYGCCWQCDLSGVIVFGNQYYGDSYYDFIGNWVEEGVKMGVLILVMSEEIIKLVGYCGNKEDQCVGKWCLVKGQIKCQYKKWDQDDVKQSK